MSERAAQTERPAPSPNAAASPMATAAAAAAPVAAASAPPPVASIRSPSSCTCGCQSALSSLTARLDASELALSRAKEENAVLRAGSALSGGGSAALGAGASLGMAFKLMDRIKEERDQLKMENAALKARIALGGGKTPLEQLLEHADLAPSTRKAVQSLPPKLQDTLAADLLRWNLRAPTDVHGNAFDINRRAMHIAKKLKEAPTPTAAGSTTPAAHHHHAHHTKPAGADAAATDVTALASPTLSRTVTTLQAEEAAHEAPRRKKIVVAKASMSDEDEDMDRANAAMRAGAAGRGSNQALSSVISPQSEIDEEENDVLSPLTDDRATAAAAAAADASSTASIDTNPLSSSLLSQTNRLIFQEDSPLYRQQLQLQRLRVAQMFAKLDSLSERTSHFAQAALAFSQAAESLSAHLNKGWEAIETNEVIDEAEAVKMDQKRVAEKAAAAAAAAASPTSDDSAAAAVSGSTVAATSSSAAPSSKPPSASPTGSSLLVPTPPSRLGGGSGGTLTSPLKIPQLQQQMLQQQQHNQRPAAHSPSLSPPPFLTSAAASTAAQPTQSHARQPSSLPPSSFSTAAASASSSAASASASASPRSGSRCSSEDPLSLSFSMGKLSSIVGCLGTVSANLGMFVSHLLVTAINSIGRKYRHEAKQSMLLMERLLLEYEEKLGLYLKKKHRDRQRLLNMTNIFGKKKVHDEDLMFLAALRRELELRRMEHVEVLNSIATLRRLELVEVVNASFMSFVTFFHEGDFLAQELRKDIESLSAPILRRKRFYDAHFREIGELKAEIKSAALPLNLAKIFSAPPCLPIGMSATDWVSNMTNTASNTMAAAAGGVAVAASSTAVVSAGSSSPSLGPASSPGDKLVFSNIGHASLIYTIPGIGVAASLTKPAQVQGYLRTQTRDGKSWKRRWHVLEKGTFFYLREAVFLAPKLIVNVLTCGARPVIKHELDFMFELISPTRTILYQAESELEMRTWVACFGNSTEYLLSMQHTRNDTENLERSMDTKSIQQEKHLKQGLLSTLRHENPTCAECGAREPDWISINLGVMICIVCSGIHRSLGVHVSKVRSIVLDDLDTELLDMMVALGNERVNAIWEANVTTHADAEAAAAAAAAGGVSPASAALLGPCKPHPGSARESKEDFIVAKYAKRRFLPVALLEASKAGAAGPSDEDYADFFRATAGEDLEVMLTYMLRGCLVDWRHPHDRHRTALHHAARHDAVLACEFLIQNNASTQLEDDDHKTALDEAKESDSKRVCARLQGCAPKKTQTQKQPDTAAH